MAFKCLKLKALLDQNTKLTDSFKEIFLNKVNLVELINIKNNKIENNNLIKEVK